MFMFRENSDQELVRETLAGHEGAFAELVKRHIQSVHAVAYARTGNHADAEDAAQEALLKAYQSLRDLREPSKFGSWIVRMTRNLAIDVQRRRERRRGLPGQFPPKPEATQVDIEQREGHDLLRQHIMALEEEPREVILLHYFADKPLREIAGLLGISRAAAQKRLWRAREVLSKSVVGALGSSHEETRPEAERVKRVLGVITAASAPWQMAAGPATAAATGMAAKASLTPLGLTLSKGVVLPIALAAGMAGLWMAVST
jgi:RNA polymerase sigma-70 factor, ECF subfamily